MFCINKFSILILFLIIISSTIIIPSSSSNKQNHEVYYSSSDRPSVERKYPSILLEDSEIYLNHKFTDGREKVVLCGIKYYDERNGQLYMQDRGAWIKNQGNGEIIYFMPGHTTADYENQNISQIILNAVNWNP